MFFLGSVFNPFPHTTYLQQTTLNVFCQNIENLHNWMDNLWQKVEHIVAKGEIACFVQFLLLSLCFQKAVCCRGVRKRLYIHYPHTKNLLQTTSKPYYQKYIYLYKSNFLVELKTFWQKDKLLVLSNFSFCNNVFKSCLLDVRKLMYVGKGYVCLPLACNSMNSSIKHNLQTNSPSCLCIT